MEVWAGISYTRTEALVTGCKSRQRIGINNQEKHKMIVISSVQRSGTDHIWIDTGATVPFRSTTPIWYWYRDQYRFPKRMGANVYQTLLITRQAGNSARAILIYSHNYNHQLTFSSSSVKSAPLEDLLMAWATPMISPSLLRIGMHRRDLVLYPVSLSISSLNRRSCNSTGRVQNGDTM